MLIDSMKRKSIFLAGHRGMVGSAVLNYLQSNGYENVITRTRGELDLINQAQVDSFFAKEASRCSNHLCSKSRRHTRKQHTSRRLYLSKSTNSK